jgi:hypothetical protein
MDDLDWSLEPVLPHVQMHDSIRMPLCLLPRFTGSGHPGLDKDDVLPLSANTIDDSYEMRLGMSLSIYNFD